MIQLLITFLFVLISGNSIENKIDNYLKEKLIGYDKYEFEIIKFSETDFEFIQKENTKLTGGINYLPVKIKKANSNYVLTYLTIRLKLYKKVFVLKNNISQKEIINPELLELKLLEVSNLKGTPVQSSDLNGLRTKIFIKAGSVLFKESLENSPVIKNGDWITASSISGNVVVEFSAEAKQEGIVGEIIRIVNKDKKQFKAKIVDSNNVIIVE